MIPVTTDIRTTRKLTKRLEDLTQESAALKAHLMPQMKALSNAVQEPVNFAISVGRHYCCFDALLTETCIP